MFAFYLTTKQDEA